MIAKTLNLPLTCEAAFDLFTGRIDEWWPPERRHAPSRASRIFVEAGGRFFERDVDGREIDLGRVRAWERPRLLKLDFFVATGAERPTDVEVRFAPVEGGSQVTIEHRPTPASEAVWRELAPRYLDSWEIVLAAFARRAG